MIYTFIAEQCSDVAVSTCCRVLEVSTSGYYQRKKQPYTDAEYVDAVFTNTLFDINEMSRGSYGSPRVMAELRLGQNTVCSKERVERLMRQSSIQGIFRRRKGCTRADPKAIPNEDLVDRAFDPDRPNKLWVMDVTEHPTSQGKVYLAVVLDAFSRRVVGWSIADHMRSELVVDALQMAAWRRRPPTGETVAHSDHGSVYTSWSFGQRMREAGLLGSMGSIGDCFDNAVAESFFGTLQLELLDQRRWGTRDQLAAALFDWIETWYNPYRRHSYCEMLSPIDYESVQAA